MRNVPRDRSTSECCGGIYKVAYTHSYIHLSNVKRKRLEIQNSHQTSDTQTKSNIHTIKILGRSDINAPKKETIQNEGNDHSSHIVYA